MSDIPGGKKGQLASAYLDIMLLMAYADDELHDREKVQMYEIIRNVPEFRALGDALQPYISGRIQQILGGERFELFDSALAVFQTKKERFRAIEMARMILVADGVALQVEEALWKTMYETLRVKPAAVEQLSKQFYAPPGEKAPPIPSHHGPPGMPAAMSGYAPPQVRHGPSLSQEAMDELASILSEPVSDAVSDPSDDLLISLLDD